jgi:hypothetical protein
VVRDIVIPDYTDLVDAMVGERISIATKMVMAHLSINIHMCHASQKKEQRAVGKQSMPADIARARGFSRRMEDQVEMIQYIRGRVGDDRDAKLLVQYEPNLGLAEKPSPALSRGKGRSEDAANKCAVEPASKRARMTNAQAHCSPSTMTNESGFTPQTPENEREVSDTSGDEGRGSPSVIDSSEYSPVSDVKQGLRKVKTEGQAEVCILRLAQSAQVLTQHQPTT